MSLLNEDLESDTGSPFFRTFESPVEIRGELNDLIIVDDLAQVTELQFTGPLHPDFEEMLQNDSLGG